MRSWFVKTRTKAEEHEYNTALLLNRFSRISNSAEDYKMIARNIKFQNAVLADYVQQKISQNISNELIISDIITAVKQFASDIITSKILK